jgi:4-aminobutyrate--pyruvate transaminase
MLDESRKIGTFGHGFTYTAHPVGCAVALKTIGIYERDKTVEHVRKVAPIFEKRIAQFADHPLVGETRARGLIGAIELVADKRTKRAFDAKKAVGTLATDILQENGLLVRAMGDSVAFCPPLIIREDEINEMFDIVGKGLRILEERLLKGNLRN